MFTNNTAPEKTQMVDTPPIRKFMFDQSFDGSSNTHRSKERPRGPVTLKPEQLDALKKEVFDAGFAAGLKAGNDDSSKKTQGTLFEIEQKIVELISNIEVIEKSCDAQMRASIMAIAKKLLPDMTARHGLQEIEALLTSVVSEMAHEPRLVVRINEAEFDVINTKIHEITTQKAFAGKVVVLADAEISVGDCRVEWADGGIERSVKNTWQKIEETVTPTT